MKTLDEVIKAWSICFSDNGRSDCTGCPYADDDGEGACFNHDREDALHYLKKYHENFEARNNQVERYQKAAKDCEEILTDYVALKQYWAEQQVNNPMTWDELQKMEGKPIWVEVYGNWYGKFWAFVEVVNNAYVNFYQKGQEYPEDLWKRDIGKTWQAYRKERS